MVAEQRWSFHLNFSCFRETIEVTTTSVQKNYLIILIQSENGIRAASTNNFNFQGRILRNSYILLSLYSRNWESTQGRLGSFFFAEWEGAAGGYLLSTWRINFECKISHACIHNLAMRFFFSWKAVVAQIKWAVSKQRQSSNEIIKLKDGFPFGYGISLIRRHYRCNLLELRVIEDNISMVNVCSRNTRKNYQSESKNKELSRCSTEGGFHKSAVS